MTTFLEPVGQNSWRDALKVAAQIKGPKPVGWETNSPPQSPRLANAGQGLLHINPREEVPALGRLGASEDHSAVTQVPAQPSTRLASYQHVPERSQWLGTADLAGRPTKLSSPEGSSPSPKKRKSRSHSWAPGAGIASVFPNEAAGVRSFSLDHIPYQNADDVQLPGDFLASLAATRLTAVPASIRGPPAPTGGLPQVLQSRPLEALQEGPNLKPLPLSGTSLQVANGEKGSTLAALIPVLISFLQNSSSQANQGRPAEAALIALLLRHLGSDVVESVCKLLLAEGKKRAQLAAGSNPMLGGNVLVAPDSFLEPSRISSQAAPSDPRWTPCPPLSHPEAIREQMTMPVEKTGLGPLARLGIIGVESLDYADRILGKSIGQGLPVRAPYGASRRELARLRKSISFGQDELQQELHAAQLQNPSQWQQQPGVRHHKRSFSASFLPNPVDLRQLSRQQQQSSLPLSPSSQTPSAPPLLPRRQREGCHPAFTRQNSESLSSSAGGETAGGAATAPQMPPAVPFSQFACKEQGESRWQHQNAKYQPLDMDEPGSILIKLWQLAQVENADVAGADQSGPPNELWVPDVLSKRSSSGASHDVISAESTPDGYDSASHSCSPPGSHLRQQGHPGAGAVAAANVLHSANGGMDGQHGLRTHSRDLKAGSGLDSFSDEVSHSSGQLKQVHGGASCQAAEHGRQARLDLACNEGGHSALCSASNELASFAEIDIADMDSSSMQFLSMEDEVFGGCDVFDSMIEEEE